jgi:hypothetical protein
MVPYITVLDIIKKKEEEQQVTVTLFIMKSRKNIYMKMFCIYKELSMTTGVFFLLFMLIEIHSYLFLFFRVDSCHKLNIFN